MAELRFTEMQARPTEFLDLTSLTFDEFEQLVPPFEAGFQEAPGWDTPDRPPVDRVSALPPVDAKRAAVLPPHVPQDLCTLGGTGAPVWHGPEQSQSVDPRALTRAVGCTKPPRRRPRTLPHGAGAAAWRGGG